MKKKEVIELIKQKDKLGMTYNTISLLSGYHPKYLINLNKQLKEGTISLTHQNKGKKPSNAMDQKEENEILSLFSNTYYKNITSFYEDYLKTDITPKRKYVTIAKLIERNLENLKAKKKFIFFNYIQIKNHKYFYAFEYPSEDILFVNRCKNYYEALTRLIRLIPDIKNLKIPFLNDKKGIYKENAIRILRTLHITTDIDDNYHLDQVAKKVREKILASNYSVKVLAKTTKQYDEILALYIPKKTIADNVIQHQKIKYKIITENTIPILSYVDLITNLPNNQKKARYNNELYDIEKILS